MALRGLLYSADEPDQELAALDGVDPSRLGARQLLWLDLSDPGPEERQRVAEWLGCEPRLFQLETGRRDRPSLANFGDVFRITGSAVALAGSQSSIELSHLTLVAGRNVVVTAHEGALAFLDELREREKGDTAIGALATESFVASLLDRLLDSYFGVVETLVQDIDRVEVALLGKRASPQFLDLLVAARKRLAELRRLLKAHRDVFYGLARPDFMATEQPEARPHFEALDRRFERAEDEVEGARELVIGSFELLSARAAQGMNETMRTLTFVTVMMGVLALIAGVMGMNFQLGLFDYGAVGFFSVIGAMLLLSGVGIWLARRRGWV
jgi:magnesium transporter